MFVFVFVYPETFHKPKSWPASSVCLWHNRYTTDNKWQTGFQLPFFPMGLIGWDWNIYIFGRKSWRLSWVFALFFLTFSKIYFAVFQQSLLGSERNRWKRANGFCWMRISLAVCSTVFCTWSGWLMIHFRLIVFCLRRIVRLVLVFFFKYRWWLKEFTYTLPGYGRRS